MMQLLNHAISSRDLGPSRYEITDRSQICLKALNNVDAKPRSSHKVHDEIHDWGTEAKKHQIMCG